MKANQQAKSGGEGPQMALIRVFWVLLPTYHTLDWEEQESIE